MVITCVLIPSFDWWLFVFFRLIFHGILSFTRFHFIYLISNFLWLLKWIYFIRHIIFLLFSIILTKKVVFKRLICRHWRFEIRQWGFKPGKLWFRITFIYRFLYFDQRLTSKSKHCFLLFLNLCVGLLSTEREARDILLNSVWF